MTKVISIANNKGGVGKTTTVLALGHRWASQGKKVLFIDLDSQANLTSTLGPEEFEPERTISEAFGTRSNLPIYAISDNIHLAPSGLSLSNFDTYTAAFKSREFLLADLLDAVKSSYDYVIIDCPPALGMITYNALVASDYLVMVASADRYSYDGMMMIAQIYNDVRESVRLNPNLSLLGVIVTKYRQNKISDFWLDKIQSEIGELMLSSVVHEATKVQQANAFRTDIFSFDPDGKATKEYIDIAEEMERRMNKE